MNDIACSPWVRPCQYRITAAWPHTFFLEGIFIAVLSCVIAAIPALLLTAVMIGNLPLPVSLPFQISVPGVVIWVVVVVLSAALATLVPAYRASRLTVREALAYL